MVWKFAASLPNTGDDEVSILLITGNGLEAPAIATYPTFPVGFNPSYNWKWSGSVRRNPAAYPVIGFNPSYNWKWSGRRCFVRVRY